MSTKITTFLLFFCLSNITIHAMHNHSMEHITRNLHENRKKTPATICDRKARFEEQRQTAHLKDARRRKNSLIHLR